MKRRGFMFGLFGVGAAVATINLPAGATIKGHLLLVPMLCGGCNTRDHYEINLDKPIVSGGGPQCKHCLLSMPFPTDTYELIAKAQQARGQWKGRQI